MCYYLLLVSLLQLISTSVLAVGATNSTKYGDETRKHDNTTASEYTVVTSFSKSTDVGNAASNTKMANDPITVNVFSTNDNVKDSEGRSNITQNDVTTTNSSKIVAVSTMDAKNATNKTNPSNNSALLNAFFPVIHASVIGSKSNNTGSKGEVGSNTDLIQGSRNGTVNNHNNTINNTIVINRKLTNATKDNQTTSSHTNTTGKMTNYTSSLIQNSENNTQRVNRRNGTNLVNNSVSEYVIPNFPNAQRENSTFKTGSKNETYNGNLRNNTLKTNNTSGLPPIPITNPIKNTVTNNVVNNVVWPFGPTEAPYTQGQTNITKIKTTTQDSAGNSTITFPDASPVPRLNNGTINGVKENNTIVTSAPHDNTTKLVNNSVSGSNFPITGEVGNLTKVNETKPVISSVFMDPLLALSFRNKEKSSTNAVNNNNTTPVNTSVTGNEPPIIYGERKASPITHDVRNTTNGTASNNPKNNSAVTNSFLISQDARNNITTSNNKPLNNSVIPFSAGRRNTTSNTSNKTKTKMEELETSRNTTQTRSIKANDVADEVSNTLEGYTRPVNHVTVIKASETKKTKKTATPESEMMDANTVHPTALMEYYELRDDGSETCDGRPDGTYAIRDVMKFLLCKNNKVKVIPCDGDMVYDVNIQKCTPRTNVSRDRFCRFRGDGTWDSPWNTRMTVQCGRGFINSESCQHDLRYDPVIKDCVEDTLIIRCFAVDRDYTNAKLGCFRKDNMKMDMLINDLPGSRGKHILDWSKFADSVESLVCRCSKAAYEKGYPFFAIRLWAECWAGKNKTDLETLVSDTSKKSEQFCYSNISIAAFDKCEDNDTRVCVGSEHGQYLYKIVNVTEVNMGTPPNYKTKAAASAASRSQINNNQVDFIDLVTLTELQKIQASGKLHLIDVREEFEYDDIGSIRDSVNIPLKDLSKALLLNNKDFKSKYGITKPAKDDCGIVFLCSSGVRSDMAYKIAKDLGYKCPKSLKGGYDLLPKVPIM